MTDNSGAQRPMTPEELVAAGLPANFHDLKGTKRLEAIAAQQRNLRDLSQLNAEPTVADLLGKPIYTGAGREEREHAELVSATRLIVGYERPTMLGIVDAVESIYTHGAEPFVMVFDSRHASVADVARERGRHVIKGYNSAHDDEHGVAGLTQLAMGRLTATADTPSGFDRHELVVAASLLLAAIDVIDRETARG